MKRLVLFLTLAVSACSHKPVLRGSGPPLRQKAVEARRQELAKSDAVPLKGKFLDYIYQIQPDHKAPGYSISSHYLNDGYASASGPYEGWLAEFFLFRGIAKDIVIEQTSGYEVSDQDKLYGFRFEPFSFTKGKMQRLEVKSVFPLDQLAAVFGQQIEKLKKEDPSTQGWAFHPRLRLPVKGTTSDMLVCKDAPEPPFATDSTCAIVGTMVWTKINFRVEPKKKIEKVSEKVY